MPSSKLRYDAPDQRGARYEAARAVIQAVARLKPEALVQLRDLEVHEAEGWDVLELKTTQLFNTRAGLDVGRIHVLTQLPGPMPAGDEIYVATDRNLETPVIGVFAPPAVIDWVRRWKLQTPEFEVTTVLLRQMWRRRPQAARECELLFSSLPSVFGDGGAKLLSEKIWQSAELRMPAVDPMFGSETDVIHEIKRVYRARAHLLESGDGLSRKRVLRRNLRQLGDHADWLARLQVCDMSPSQVASAVNREVQAVYLAVRRLARFLELELQPLPRVGRGLGRGDVSSGRRPQRS